MDQNIAKNLNKLKSIRPDEDYARQSRLSIVSSGRISNGVPEIKRGWAVAVLNNSYLSRMAFSALAVVLLIIGTVYFVNNRLTQNNLVVKASEMNASIQVKLNEIQYLLQNKGVNYSDIADIQSLLVKAEEELKGISADGNLDKSLERIKSAQEALYRIDVLLTGEEIN
jgi:hypothetical protein